MAHQIKNIIKTSAILVNPARGLSSGILNGSSLDNSSNTLNSNKLHLAIQREYPQAERLPIPPNIDATETSRFSPLRNRDINASAITVQEKFAEKIDITLDQTKDTVQPMIIYDDPHLSLYDANTPVNTGAVMQSTVPEPYGGNGKFTNLNMPGGSWGLQTKYLSHELNSAHYTQLRQDIRSHETSHVYKGISANQSMCRMTSFLSNSNLLLFNHHNSPFLTINKRFISLSATKNSPDKSPTSGESEKSKSTTETAQSKLKRAVKEYGSTVIVFHVAISLLSLGTSYALVSSGLDVAVLLEKLNLADKFPKLAENASTFVIAYAIHKIFAPVRITITLGSVPFIVRFLRKRGILK